MKTCKKCNTENPSKATHCMKCGAMLVDEYQLSEEEKLQKKVQDQQKEIDLLKLALDTTLKNNSTSLNLELEKERDALKKENEQLNGQIAKMEIEIKDLKDYIKTLNGELSSNKDSVRKLKDGNAKLLAGRISTPEQGKDSVKKEAANNTKRLCPHCGKEIAAEAMFCKYCGHNITMKENTNKKWCIKCGAELKPTSKFCPKCGMQQNTADQSSGYVDLGLPSGTLWKDTNENGSYDYNEAVRTFGKKLPSKEQFMELVNLCEWTWEGRDYKVTGLNGNSIVLSLAGYRTCDGGDYGVGTNGRYWSSTPCDSGYAWSLCLFSDKVRMNKTECYSYGFVVRLVQD